MSCSFESLCTGFYLVALPQSGFCVAFLVQILLQSFTLVGSSVRQNFFTHSVCLKWKIFTQDLMQTSGIPSMHLSTID
jgi:hypothetical protein